MTTANTIPGHTAVLQTLNPGPLRHIPHNSHNNNNSNNNNIMPLFLGGLPLNCNPEVGPPKPRSRGGPGFHTGFGAAALFALQSFPAGGGFGGEDRACLVSMRRWSSAFKVSGLKCSIVQLLGLEIRRGRVSLGCFSRVGFKRCRRDWLLPGDLRPDNFQKLLKVNLSNLSFFPRRLSVYRSFSTSTSRHTPRVRNP